MKAAIAVLLCLCCLGAVNCGGGDGSSGSPDSDSFDLTDVRLKDGDAVCRGTCAGTIWADATGVWIIGNSSTWRLDPDSLAIELTLDVGSNRDPAVTTDAIYSVDDGELRRIEKASGAVSSTNVDPTTESLVFAFEQLWLTTGSILSGANTLSVLDARGPLVSPTLARRVDGVLGFVIHDGGALWLTGLTQAADGGPESGFVLHLPGGRLDASASIPIPTFPPEIVFAGGTVVSAGALWMPNPLESTVVRLDTGTASVSVHPVEGEIGRMFGEGGAVWAVIDGTLHGVDPASGQVTVASDEQLTSVKDVVVTEDGVWVSARNRVLLLDPGSLGLRAEFRIVGADDLALSVV